jgi:hypothetical protein
MYGAILCLAAAIVLAIPLFNASAQSGRAVQQPTPTPTPQAASPKRSETKPSFVVDASAEKYRVVFATSFDGTFDDKGNLYLPEYDPARPSRYNNFIEQLNKAGEQGYRLLAARSSFPIAIVKQDEAQYEYAYFETSTCDPLSIGLDFALEYARLAKQGFHLVGRVFVRKDCQTDDNDSMRMPGMEMCEEKSLYLLEREKGVEKPVRFIVPGSGARWSASKQTALLQSQVDENRAEGYYPTYLFSRFEVLLEQTDRPDHPWAGKGDVRVVMSGFWRDDAPKKINELAQQGYRLGLVNKGIAVMYKSGEEGSTPVSYLWVDAGKKELEKELQKLQQSGAIYRMAYPVVNGKKHQLIFEQRGTADRQRREYKVLKLILQNTGNAATKKVQTDLAPPSKEAVETLNALIKDGFVVRDLFVPHLASDEVNILLERPL